MRKLFAMVVVVLVGATATTAHARSAHVLIGNTRSMTGAQIITRQRVIIKHDMHVLRWFKVHPTQARTAIGRREVKFARAQRSWTRKELRESLKAYNAARSSGPSWLVGAFECIHRYEGAWDDNTGNGYYGGLQMDYGFMSRYGASYLHKYGTADRWPADVQIQVAVNAYQAGRGFYPWPNTARICRLI